MVVFQSESSAIDTQVGALPLSKFLAYWTLVQYTRALDFVGWLDDRAGFYVSSLPVSLLTFAVVASLPPSASGAPSSIHAINHRATKLIFPEPSLVYGAK